jgi:hypothetical protein
VTQHPVTTFRVGSRELRIWMQDGRWYVAVDGVQLPIWHKVQADAWTAGVTEADRLDRGEPRPPSP